ncbi:hypothetical protein LTR85_012153 [Meristemomyces frigidus]|nr:hypothetical protein LTR85_012153 [Meristemomyces frigidus]
MATKDYLDGLPRFDSNDVLGSDDPETKSEKYRRLAFQRVAIEWQTSQWRTHIIRPLQCLLAYTIRYRQVLGGLKPSLGVL